MRFKRDAEHRESLSTTMRSLRAENIKYISDISKLEEKTAEAQRKLEISTAAENAAKTQLKSAESTVRGLKEQLARTKALVTQTRTSCATEVRRRDRQIDTLKKQLGEAGRARGARANPAITTITITGNVDEEPPSPTKTGGSMTDEYSLRGESTVALAKLSQNLSEENEAVLALVAQTMGQLREMSGWDEVKPEHTQSIHQQSLEDMSMELDSVMEHMRHILNNPSFVPIEEVVSREEEINRLKDGWVKMETRWKDAMLLIDGWRKRMAAGGSPIREDELKLGFHLGSVRLTGTTNASGDSTLAPLPEEAFEEDQPMRYGGDDIYENSDDESDNYEHEDEHNARTEAASDAAMADDAPVEEEEVEDPPADEVRMEEDQNEEALVGEERQYEVEEPAAEVASRESTPLPELPQMSPLRNSSSAGNRGSQQAPAPAHATMITRRKPETAASSSLPAPSARSRPASGTLHLQKRGLEQPSRRPTRIASRVPEVKSNIRPPTRVTSLEEALLSKPVQSQEPAAEQVEAQPKAQPKPEVRQSTRTETRVRKTTTTTAHRPTGKPTPHKQFPRPAEPVSQQSPLTMSNIAAKLAASEADAARVRAKLQAARSRSTTIKPSEGLGASHSSVGTGEAVSGQETQGQVLEIAESYDKPAHDAENVDPTKVDREPTAEENDGHLKVQKRKRDIRISSKRTSRRRSTLSPMELETLISGAGQ